MGKKSKKGKDHSRGLPQQKKTHRTYINRRPKAGSRPKTGDNASTLAASHFNVALPRKEEDAREEENVMKLVDNTSSKVLLEECREKVGLKMPPAIHVAVDMSMKEDNEREDDTNNVEDDTGKMCIFIRKDECAIKGEHVVKPGDDVSNVVSRGESEEKARIKMVTSNCTSVGMVTSEEHQREDVDILEDDRVEVDLVIRKEEDFIKENNIVEFGDNTSSEVLLGECGGKARLEMASANRVVYDTSMLEKNKRDNMTTIVEDDDVKVEPFIAERLGASFKLLTESQKKLAIALCSSPTNQHHLFEHWTKSLKVSSSSSLEDNRAKQQFMKQLECMDLSYPRGGLVGYVKNAKQLLEVASMGINPLEGWIPSIPTGKTFEIGSDEYESFEKLGLLEIGKCGFALVAGGLGERLEYNGIKLSLPTELGTYTTYLQLYIETILAIQSRYAAPSVKLPLCIMVSKNTIEGTLALLKNNNNYGMDDDQITIVHQGDGVPALVNNNAMIALDPVDKYRVIAKPHGHGDIHSLLYCKGVAKKWHEEGIEWVLHFQDTNGLAFHTLALAMGVSRKFGWIMNSIVVPRKAKQAVGGIARLRKATGEERMINVEYNQLDPLLRDTTFLNGDVNDESTGYSPFPGNINQLLFRLVPYLNVLERTKGAMPEFVNPKYSNVEKSMFQKPTRLECMMQDFPAVLDADESNQVGFTCIAADLCFSPVKNATANGVFLQAKGIHPCTAASGEADQYAAIRNIMRSIGCQIKDARPLTYNGINIVPGPEIVLKPSFVLCRVEYKATFPNPSMINISSRSSLVVEGNGIIIESLDLDGALVIKCEDGASGQVCGLVVKNKGWEKVMDDSSDSSDIIRMRGYHLNKIETKTVLFRKGETIEEDFSSATKVMSPNANYSPPYVLDVTKPAIYESSESNPCCCTIV